MTFLHWLKARLSEGATWSAIGVATTATLAVREQLGDYLPLVLACSIMGVLLKDKGK